MIHLFIFKNFHLVYDYGIVVVCMAVFLWVILFISLFLKIMLFQSHREDQKFILTQNPLADTIVDFWRMVYENGVSAIVAFDKVASEVIFFS